MADREQPYDPYIPAEGGNSGGSGGGQNGTDGNGNQRTAALQAVRMIFFGSRRVYRRNGRYERQLAAGLEPFGGGIHSCMDISIVQTAQSGRRSGEFYSVA